MRRFSCLIIFLTLILYCKGRDTGVVTGEITSKEDGKAIQGVEVVIRDTGVVTGEITSKEDGKAIQRGEVVVRDAGQSAVTDMSGMYTLKGVTEGEFILCFTHVEYDTIEVFLSVMFEGEEFLINVAMQRRE